MNQSKSIYAKEIYYRDGKEVSVYISRCLIPCEQCGVNIKPNEMFSRSADKKGTIAGIRYSFCRKCKPFDKAPVDLEKRKAHIGQSKILEQSIWHSTDWQSLAGSSELVTFSLDVNGNANVTGYMGMPFKRNDAVWLMRVIQRYLEQNSTEEIDKLYQDWYDEINNPYITTQESYRSRKVKGHVYLLHGGGYFKIGKTTDLSARSQQISLQLPFEVKLIHSISTNNITETERYWHNKFKPKRLNGEWFNLSEEDVVEFTSMYEMRKVPVGCIHEI